MKPELIQAWERNLKKKDRRPIDEWASDNIYLEPPLTLTGPFDSSRSRHFIAPMEAMRDDYCREINILKPVRGGGTLMADIFAAWQRDIDPGPLLFVLQTDQIAKLHWENVLGKILHSAPRVRAMMESLHKWDSNKCDINFADGNRMRICGPSISNLQTSAYRYLILDECWLYPEMIGNAEGRIGDFLKMQTSKVVRVSQGGPKPGLDIDQCAWCAATDNGQQNEWQIQCMSCGHYMTPTMSGQRADGTFWGLQWDKVKKPNGDWMIDKAAETVRFECEQCGHPHFDCPKTKSEWNRTGRYYVSGEKNRRKQTFHWPALIDYPWRELCELWLGAQNAFNRGDLLPKIEFYQKRMAQHMDEDKLLKTSAHLNRVAYEISSDWADEKLRCLTIDRQQHDLFWWTVRAWGTGKTRRLGFGRAFSFHELREIQQKHKVSDLNVGIDSRYEPKGDNGVFAACARYGWLAMMGDPRPYFLRMVRGTNRMSSFSKTHRRESGLPVGQPQWCDLKMFSKHQMNNLVHMLIENGSWHEPPANSGDEMEHEYGIQMASRSKREAYDAKTNRRVTYWKEGKNDHARDLANMQCVLALIHRLIPDPLEGNEVKSEA